MPEPPEAVLTLYQWMAPIGVATEPRRMPKNTSITIGEHFDRFIAAQISAGRFGSASEVVRAGLRLLEERETKLAALRSALERGEQSGVAEGYTLDRLLKKLDKERGG